MWSIKKRCGNEDGIIQLFPLVVIVVLLLFALALKGDSFQKNGLSRAVLSENSGSGSDSSGSGSSGSSDDSVETENENEVGDDTTENETEQHDRMESEDVNIEGSKVETEIRYANGIRVKTKTEDNGQEKVEVYSKGRKIKFRIENGVTTMSIEGQDDQVQEERPLGDGEKIMLPGLETEVRVKGEKFVIVDGDSEAETKFPLSVDLETNELVVTTPSGVKRVAVLPSQAIENMLRVGKVDVIIPPSDDNASPTPNTNLESGNTEDQIEIDEENGTLVYKLHGVSKQKFLGVLNVDIPRTVISNAENGEIIDIQQSFIDRIIDLLSF